MPRFCYAHSPAGRRSSLLGPPEHHSEHSEEPCPHWVRQHEYFSRVANTTWDIFVGVFTRQIIFTKYQRNFWCRKGKKCQSNVMFQKLSLLAGNITPQWPVQAGKTKHLWLGIFISLFAVITRCTITLVFFFWVHFSDGWVVLQFVAFMVQLPTF